MRYFIVFGLYEETYSDSSTHGAYARPFLYSSKNFPSRRKLEDFMGKFTYADFKGVTSFIEVSKIESELFFK
jgi:hypothetical protein